MATRVSENTDAKLIKPAPGLSWLIYELIT
jgi:hypothetical protein